MNTTAHSFTRLAATALFLAASQFITLPAAAAPTEDYRNAWMAASGTAPEPSTNWGRLTLRDGVLRFESASIEWQLALSDIKRASISEKSDRVIALESAAGENYYVTIYGQQLTVESPRRALQLIQKALRAPAARHELRTASAPAPHTRTGSR